MGGMEGGLRGGRGRRGLEGKGQRKEWDGWGWGGGGGGVLIQPQCIEWNERVSGKGFRESDARAEAVAGDVGAGVMEAFVVDVCVAVRTMGWCWMGSWRRGETCSAEFP